MKLLRIAFLVLLAALLPIRGVMAAAMLCPPGGSGSHNEMQLTNHPSGAHEQAAEGAGALHQHEHSANHDKGSGHGDKCNLCSACCSLTPIWSHIASVAEPRDFSGISYPALSAPAPSFISDGQERPPRSI